MDICSSGHDEIVYEGGYHIKCPVCELLDTVNEMTIDQEQTIEHYDAVLDRPTGNHVGKVWIRSDMGESLTRTRKLHDDLFEVYVAIKKYINAGSCTSNIGFVLDYMKENYPEELI